MCFLEDNKYFIQSKFFTEMRGLTEEDKKLRYDEIRPEVIVRIKESYKSCVDKNLFYSDLFQIIGNYDNEYVWSNLFFEDNSSKIISYLFKDKYAYISFSSPEDSIAFKYQDYLERILILEQPVGFRDEFTFLKESFCELVPALEKKNFDFITNNENPLMNNYANWFFEKLWIDSNLVHNSFLLFVKLWNCIPNLFSPFNNPKAIVFYNYINQQLEKEVSSADQANVFLAFINRCRFFFDDLFVSLNYIPLLDEKLSGEYREGYINQRERFFKNLERLQVIGDISLERTYSELFSLSTKHEGNIFCIIENAIEAKANSLEYPNYEEVNEIAELELSPKSNRLRKDLFEKLYLFEAE